MTMPVARTSMECCVCWFFHFYTRWYFKISRAHITYFGHHDNVFLVKTRHLLAKGRASWDHSRSHGTAPQEGQFKAVIPSQEWGSPGNPQEALQSICPLGTCWSWGAGGCVIGELQDHTPRQGRQPPLPASAQMSHLPVTQISASVWLWLWLSQPGVAKWKPLAFSASEAQGSVCRSRVKGPIHCS